MKPFRHVSDFGSSYKNITRDIVRQAIKELRECPYLEPGLRLKKEGHLMDPLGIIDSYLREKEARLKWKQ